MEPPFLYQRHTGRVLTRREFEEDVTRRVAEEARRHRLFGPGDTVLLAVSGGKDSFVLVDVMAKIHSVDKLVAVTVIEGIHGLGRETEVEKMKKILGELGIDYHVVSFKEIFGVTMDRVVEEIIRRGLSESPCTFCGVMKRRSLNRFAREIGATRVATAHNLDDEAQTLVMNILRGDTVRLPRLHPLAPSLSERFVQRIKPLRKIYEYETTAYAYMKGFRFQVGRCIYVDLKPTLRTFVRRMLYRAEAAEPGFTLRLLETVDELMLRRLNAVRGLPRLPVCRICGEPTSYGRDICKVCELLMKIGVEPA